MVKRICSRCQLLDDPSSGQFNLFVKSVRLGEDERFECQVLPGPQAHMKVPLRASVRVQIQGEHFEDQLANVDVRAANGLVRSLVC